MAQKRVFELYEGPNGVTPKTTWYGRPYKIIYRVRAYSARQAVKLVNEHIWAERETEIGRIS